MLAPPPPPPVPTPLTCDIILYCAEDFALSCFSLTLGAHAQRGLLYLLCLSVCSLYHYRSNSSSLRPNSSTYRFIIGFCWISTRGFSIKNFRSRVMASFSYHDYCHAIHGSFFDWISFSSCCGASCTLNLCRMLISITK